MLELRPGCETCDRHLPGDSDSAWICSFECTFCAQCARDDFKGVCPNCGGELVRRPRRPPAELQRHPASTTHVHRPQRPAEAVPQAPADARMPAQRIPPETTRVPAAAATRRPKREMATGDRR